MNSKKKLVELNTKIFKDKKVLLVALLGVIGMVLILFSNKIFGATDKSYNRVSFDEREYVENLEKRLKEVLVQIEGVGECGVFITLKGGAEYVYATEGKSTASEAVNSSGASATSQHGKEDSYIIVRDSGGSESPILLTTLNPSVNGVAIVCTGGDKVSVQQKVIETVSAVLDIPSNKISVIKKRH